MTSTPRFITIKAPGNEELSRQLTSLLPPDAIQSNRAAIQKICYKCEKSTEDLKKCGKCKAVWYCSEQCQRADWKNHKPICNSADPEGFVRLQKLSQIFMANPILMLYIQKYCALTFGLTDSESDPNQPRRIFVDIGIEPVDITKCNQLFCTNDDVPTPIRGMVQVTTITKHPESELIPEDRMVIWRHSRKQVCDDGQDGEPVILVEYRLRENQSTITTAVTIPPPVLQMVRERKPYQCVSGIRGQFEKAMTEDNVLEMLNMMIRQDKRNQFRLQTDMVTSDIDIIQKIKQGGELSNSMKRFLLKRNREDIYKPILACSQSLSA
ncbi:hypothetical protein K435DRAFT_777092 [Dendrothele bispora CBS 962.96]|uniref:MYND-type domain-containing protein n=1 Tax=Dendrothele bispora (strain CBS 962.96) TaxID=1314807 RepID=A0A4S8MA87_DENBC|nr:hypothetical protein K435DRAFT_777092 [Dendrothele bispora CBS 962.96]